MRTRFDQMEREFELFDRLNPQVWESFKQFTWEALASGRNHFSVDMVVGRVRWELALRTRSDDGFKVNNNFRAFYARKFMREYPEHDGFFRTREQTSHHAPPHGVCHE